MEIKADQATILFANLTFAVRNHTCFYRDDETVLEVSPDDYQALLAMRLRIAPPPCNEADRMTFRGIPIESNDNVQPSTFRIARVLKINEDIFG